MKGADERFQSEANSANIMSMPAAATDALTIGNALRALPKAELHLHLEGSVNATTFAEMARHHDVELPPHSHPAELFDYSDLAGFLDVYALVAASMIDRRDFERVTYECLERCAANGARHVEMFFSPEAHIEHGVPYDTVLAGITAGVRHAEVDFGLSCLLIPAINRELGGLRAVEFVEMVLAHRTDDIIGVGLDFNEIGYPPELFVDAFRLAEQAGLRRTSHAGEVGPAQNVRDGIELLHCERVDHGYNIVQDPELLAECVASQVPFTVCPTTTTFTTDHRDLSAADHPIRVMYDAGLNMTVNSDDPTMFGAELTDEYSKLNRLVGFSFDELAQLALASLDAAWIDEPTKSSWRAEWASDIECISARLDEQ